MTKSKRTEEKVTPTVEERQETNSMLTDIITSASKDAQEMLQGTQREVREVTYDYDNPLSIPEELEKRMEGEGYGLRWLRFKIEGNTDVKNITKRVRQGYSLVTRGEAKELSAGLAGMSDDEFVVVDDSVLAKIPLERQKELKGQLGSRASRQEEGIRAEFREQARKNRINLNDFDDRSASSVTGGSKRRTFADG